MALVFVYAAGLLFVGAASHIADFLRSGLRPYRWAPDRLNLYWSSLAVFDPLAALLLIRGRRSGVDLACVIVATDPAADWYAVYGIQRGDVFDRPGPQRLTLFALFVLTAAPAVRSRLGPAVS